MRREQALVHDGAARQTRHVKALAEEIAALHLFARKIERVFECLRVVGAWRDERLAYTRQRRAGARAKLIGINRHVAPAEQAQSLHVESALHERLALRLGQEEHPHAERVVTVEAT